VTKTPYKAVTIGGNPIDILNIEVSNGHKQTCARCSIETDDITGVNLNQEILVDIGYVGNHGQIFKGYVDEISETRMPGTYSIEGRDILKKAIEHFIVSADIEVPWCRSHITAEGLVEDLLNEAQIYAYNGDVTHFTFGIQCPAEFNLMSSWDAISQICNILAYNCFAVTGTVYFTRVFPIPSGAPTANFTVGNAGNILTIKYNYNTENLRNRVVVFGYGGIYAERKVASPYLPVDFYKTAIVSSELIEQQSMADDSAQYNLQLYNKLTESLHIDAEGDHTVKCRDTVSVTEPFTGMSADHWFVFSINHRIDDAGYKMSMSLSR